MAKTSVIIVAGGSGSRMGAEIPKQFIKVNGREILARALEKFMEALPDSEIIVVLPETEIGRWNEITERYGLKGTHKVCAGGDNRFSSVKNGLTMTGKSDYVAVHDGVRPLLSAEMIRRCIGEAAEHGSAIPVTEPVDSFRIMNGGRLETIDRSLLRAVQTPQVFRTEMLKEAYETEFSPLFTDDASVAEHYGIPLHFCEGERENIKITTKTDLIFAEAILFSRGK